MTDLWDTTCFAATSQLLPFAVALYHLLLVFYWRFYECAIPSPYSGPSLDSDTLCRAINGNCLLLANARVLRITHAVFAIPGFIGSSWYQLENVFSLAALIAALELWFVSGRHAKKIPRTWYYGNLPRFQFNFFTPKKINRTLYKILHLFCKSNNTSCNLLFLLLSIQKKIANNFYWVIKLSLTTDCLKRTEAGLNQTHWIMKCWTNLRTKWKRKILATGFCY